MNGTVEVISFRLFMMLVLASSFGEPGIADEESRGPQKSAKETRLHDAFEERGDSTDKAKLALQPGKKFDVALLKDARLAWHHGSLTVWTTSRSRWKPGKPRPRVVKQTTGYYFHQLGTKTTKAIYSMHGYDPLRVVCALPDGTLLLEDNGRLKWAAPDGTERDDEIVLHGVRASKLTGTTNHVLASAAKDGKGGYYRIPLKGASLDLEARELLVPARLTSRPDHTHGSRSVWFDRNSKQLHIYDAERSSHEMVSVERGIYIQAFDGRWAVVSSDRQDIVDTLSAKIQRRTVYNPRFIHDGIGYTVGYGHGDIVAEDLEKGQSAEEVRLKGGPGRKIVVCLPTEKGLFLKNPEGGWEVFAWVKLPDRPSDQQIEEAVRAILDPATPRGQRWPLAKVIQDAGPRANRFVPRLTKGLLHKSLEVQDKAGSAIDAMGIPPVEVVPRLVGVLKLDEPKHYAWANTRSVAARALGRIGPDAHAAVPALVGVLKEPRSRFNHRVQIAAIVAMGRIGAPAKSALPVLEERSKEPFAPEAIAKIKLAVELNIQPGKQMSAKAVTTLIERMEHKSEPMHLAAADLLARGIERMSHDDRERAIRAALDGLITYRGRFGMTLKDALNCQRDEFLIDPLIRSLKHQSPLVRNASAAMLALRRGRAAPAVPALIDAIEDDSSFVRTEAAQALAEIAPANKDVIAALKKAIDENRDKGSMLEALVNIGEPALEELAQHIGTKTNLGRFEPGAMTISKALVRIGDPSVPLLRKAVTSEDAFTRRMAIFTLGQIGAPGKDAAADIRKALNDKDDEVRRDAAVALSKIGVRDKSAIPILIEMIESGKYDTYGRNPAHAVEALGLMGPLAEETLPLLEKMAKSEHVYLSSKAKAAIKQVRADKTDIDRPANEEAEK